MLAFGCGGECKGIVLRLPPHSVKAELHGLVRRENRFFLPAYTRRWVRAETAHRAVDALTFVIDRTQSFYVGGPLPDQIADALAVAAGQIGSMCDYAHSTIEHLEAHGLTDRALWRLEAMIALRLEARDRADKWPHTDIGTAIACQAPPAGAECLQFRGVLRRELRWSPGVVPDSRTLRT